MKHQGESRDIVDNINDVDRDAGNSKAYTLSRLKKESPDAVASELIEIVNQ